MIPDTDHGTVLVIDDEPDNLRLTLEMLREHGLEVLSARDGPAGLHIAGHLRPDLILLDIGMPGLDGFQVCRRLKADPATRECPVIFLTALGQIEDKARGFAEGGVDYVTKPFDARELLLRITSHLHLAWRLHELQERLHERDTPPPDPESAGPAQPLDLLLRARDLLLANLTDPPDLATLARRCGTNRTSLERLFKEYLGMTVFGYLREQRLQRARYLLEQGHHTVDATAAAVGYYDGRDLARAFKQRFGLGPGALSRAA